MATIYEIIEKARKTGKIEKGSNEATKAAERGTAKVVVYAANVDPKQIVQHLPIICKEKNILCVEADDKKKAEEAAKASAKAREEYEKKEAERLA